MEVQNWHFRQSAITAAQRKRFDFGRNIRVLLAPYCLWAYGRNVPTWHFFGHARSIPQRFGAFGVVLNPLRSGRNRGDFRRVVSGASFLHRGGFGRRLLHQFDMTTIITMLVGFIAGVVVVMASRLDDIHAAVCRIERNQNAPPEPKKESPCRSGTEYVFQGYGETRTVTCESCELDYPGPVSTKFTNICPACGHTNLPF